MFLITVKSLCNYHIMLCVQFFFLSDAENFLVVDGRNTELPMGLET